MRMQERMGPAAGRAAAAAAGSNPRPSPARPAVPRKLRRQSVRWRGIIPPGDGPTTEAVLRIIPWRPARNPVGGAVVYWLPPGGDLLLSPAWLKNLWRSPDPLTMHEQTHRN